MEQPPQPTPEHSRGRPLLGPWGMALLFLVTVTVIWTSVDRYQDPVGEKNVLLMPPGGADFFPVFSGSRALVLGANPYLNDIPEFDDLWQRYWGAMDGKPFKTNYFPAHHLLYLPLALWTADWREASRVLFFINVVMLFGLAAVTWWLLGDVLGWTGQTRRFSLSLIPLFFVVIATNIASGLALERGDAGDIAGALMLWGSIALFVKGHRFAPMFLAVTATLLKGYGAVFVLGLGALCLTRRSWKQALAGVVAALAIFVLPVAHYLPEWWTWAQFRFNLYVPAATWLNVSFPALFRNLAAPLEKPGSLLMTGTYLLTSLACWVRARKAASRELAGTGTLWLCLFGLTSLTPMLAAAPLSLLYNLVIMIPGALILFLATETFGQATHLPPPVMPIVGTLQLVTAFLLFKMKLGSPYISMAAISLIVMVLTIAGCMLWGARRTPVLREPG